MSDEVTEHHLIASILPKQEPYLFNYDYYLPKILILDQVDRWEVMPIILLIFLYYTLVFELCLRKMIIPSTRYFTNEDDKTGIIKISCNTLQPNVITGDYVMETFAVKPSNSLDYTEYQSIHSSFYPIINYNIRELEFNIQMINTNLPLLFKQPLPVTIHLYFRKAII